jgi:hypothetical protein
MKFFRRAAVIFCLLWTCLYINAHIRIIWTKDAIYITKALALACNSPSGFLKTFGAMNTGDLLSLGPDCEHAQGGAAGSFTTNNVIYTIPLTGGVAETQTLYNFRTVVNVTDFGAVGDGVTDDAPAFRAAYDAIANGGLLHIPTTTAFYLWNSCRNGAVLESTGTNANKIVNLAGDGWNLKTSGSLGTPRGSIIKFGSSIPSTCDGIHYAPTDQISGLTITGIEFSNVGGPFGRHWLFIDGTNANGYITDLLVFHNFFDNTATGNSIRTTQVNASPFAGGIAFSKITDNALMSFNADFLGDEVQIAHNRFGQNATNDARNIGIQFENISGATSTLIFHNVFSNFNQMILVRGGTKPIIRDNEFELGATFSSAAMVDLSGVTNTVTSATITGNSFSQNVGASSVPLIRVANAAGTQIYGNRLTEISTVAYDYITITGAASATFVGYNRCEFLAGATPDLSCTISSLGPNGFQYTPFGFTLPGTSTGFSFIKMPASAAGTILFPTPAGPFTDTLALLANAQTFLNKTLTTPTITQPSILGVTSGAAACAGCVGEYLESVVNQGSAIALTTGTAANVTSLVLTAGDWDLSANISFLPGGSPSVTVIAGSSSLVSATFDTSNGRFVQIPSAAYTATFGSSFAFKPLKFNVTVNTTVFLVAFANFTVGTLGGYGIISARRVH